jgi:hypothetical protein
MNISSLGGRPSSVDGGEETCGRNPAWSGDPRRTGAEFVCIFRKVGGTKPDSLIVTQLGAGEELSVVEGLWPEAGKNFRYIFPKDEKTNTTRRTAR